MAEAIKRDSARARKPLTRDRLKQVLHYNLETGAWTRLVTAPGYHAGDRAGSEKKHGYRTIDVDGARYYEHRLAVFYVTGEWPTTKIDHRNNRPATNAWGNLRPASNLQNMANRRMNRTNHLGFKGVCEHIDPRRKKRFGARIKVNRKSKHLGWFYTPQEAHAAYAEAAREAFGEFARTE